MGIRIETEPFDRNKKLVKFPRQYCSLKFDQVSPKDMKVCQVTKKRNLLKDLIADLVLLAPFLSPGEGLPI